MLLTRCGAELCGPHLTSPVRVQILLPFRFVTTQGETTLCWQLCPQTPLLSAQPSRLQSSELFVPNAASRSPARAARLCGALGTTGLGAEALLLVGQLSPGLVPPLPLPAHDRCNRRRACFSRSCCLDPWCSGRLCADPGAVDSPSPPSQSLVPPPAPFPAWLWWDPAPKRISIETAEFGCCFPETRLLLFLGC